MTKDSRLPGAPRPDPFTKRGGKVPTGEPAGGLKPPPGGGSRPKPQSGDDASSENRRG